MLTDTKLRNLKPKEKLYKVNDRDGLYVAVTTAGSISFRYNYSINGRQETITFGRYGTGGITLAEARERLGEAKKMVAAGKSHLPRRKLATRLVARAQRRLMPGLRNGCAGIRWQTQLVICAAQCTSVS
jgi:hypothetical protein